MRFLSFILLFFCLIPRPGHALEEISYDVEFMEQVEPFVKTLKFDRSEDTVAALLKFIDSPTTTARQKYLAWRRIGVSFIFDPSILNEDNRQRFFAQNPEPKDYLFQLRLMRHDPRVSDEARLQSMERILERSLKEFPNTSLPAMAADALADYHIFHDSPLDAIIVLEKGLKTLDKEAFAPRRYLYNHLAILYTDVFQSDENIKKGIALYKELEFRNNSGRVRPESVMVFNQGIAYLFSLHDFQAAVDAFAKIDIEDDGEYAEGLVYSAAALTALGQREEAWKRVQEFDRRNYADPTNRMIFLGCIRDMVLFELNKRDDMKSCHFVSDNYYSSAIDVVMFMDVLVKRPVPKAEEFEILKNFRTYFLTRFKHRIKNSTSKTISHLELEKARIEEERIRFEAEMEKKSGQLKTFVLYSTVMVIVILGLAVWRVWWKNRRIEALQNYIKTNILQRFLPEALIKEILQGKSRLEQEPQKKLITILFADLVAFSATTEALGTDGIARLLNAYLKAMTEVVFAHGGTIDKFIGDAVMVIFGAPFESSPQDQVGRAVSCAEDMFHALESLNHKWQVEFSTTFEMRIGINTGEAIVGSFGSEKRSDYTVIGNAVNIAARIETLAPPGQIIMSRNSAEYYNIRGCASMGLYTLKGVTGQQELFQVIRTETARDWIPQGA